MKKLTILLSIIFCFLFISVKADNDKKSRSYKCKHIGIQKIKNKKFKVKQDNKKNKSKKEIIESTCNIPIRSPRFAYHTSNE